MGKGERGPKNSAERHFEWRYQRELYGFTLAWLTCYKGCRCQPLWTDHAAPSVVVGLSEWVISQLIVFWHLIWLPACWQAWYYWHIGGLGCAELTKLTNNCGSGSVYLYTYRLQFWPMLLCSRTEARENRSTARPYRLYIVTLSYVLHFSPLYPLCVAFTGDALSGYLSETVLNSSRCFFYRNLKWDSEYCI